MTKICNIQGGQGGQGGQAFTPLHRTLAGGPLTAVLGYFFPAIFLGRADARSREKSGKNNTRARYTNSIVVRERKKEKKGERKEEGKGEEEERREKKKRIPTFIYCGTLWNNSLIQQR